MESQTKFSICRWPLLTDSVQAHLFEPPVTFARHPEVRTWLRSGGRALEDR